MEFLLGELGKATENVGQIPYLGERMKSAVPALCPVGAVEKG